MKVMNLPSCHVCYQEAVEWGVVTSMSLGAPRFKFCLFAYGSVTFSTSYSLKPSVSHLGNSTFLKGSVRIKKDNVHKALSVLNKWQLLSVICDPREKV